MTDPTPFDPIRSVLREVADLRTRIMGLAKCTLMLQRQIDLLTIAVGPEKVEAAGKAAQEAAMATADQVAT